MQVLRNMITLVTTRNNVEFAIIGAVILLGVVADELTRRFAAKRRTAQVLQGATAA
jgi:ribose transport system permease protein